MGTTGYTRAMGVVTATGRSWPDNECVYYYTRLSGIRAWNTNAVISTDPP